MTLWQDARYALRGMRRSPGFAAVAVLSLGLGIGANTAIFSLIDTLILRPLPVSEPGRLVEFLNQYPGDPPLNSFDWRSYEYFRDHNQVFAGLSGDRPGRFHVRGEGVEPETVEGECVPGSLFPLLGVKPAMGRLIGPEEDAGSTVAVVSWSYWQNRFNASPAIVGRHLVVEDVPVTVIGVAPRNFFGLQPGFQPDVWVSAAVGQLMAHGERGSLRLIARLKPGVSMAQARAEMAVLFRFTREEMTRGGKDPAAHQVRFTVESAGAGLSTPLRSRFAKPLLALMAVVALLLLIACTNVASMLLARGAARQREMAVRASLGASGLRLVRQVLTESLMLAGAGGLLGILVAYFGAGALVRIVTSGRFIGGPPHLEVPLVPDGRVLLFTAGVAVLTGVLFGLVPAWSALASAPASSLRDAGRAGETRFRRVFGKSLVMAQVALSVGLLSAAILFIGNLSNIQHMGLGFQREHVLLVTLDAARSGYSGEQLLRAYPEVLARLEKIPGVRSASTIDGPGPLSGAGASRYVTVEGHAERPEDRRRVSVSWVGPKYFETMGTPLPAGRDFSFEDQGRPRVAIVNEAMARYYFGGGDAIGKQLTMEGDTHAYQIVGIAGDARYYDIREETLRTIYLNTFQFARPASTFTLGTRVDPRSVALAARRAIREFLKDATIARVTTLSDQVNATIVPERLVAMLSGAFGAVGSLLAAIGMYGLLAYTVTRRTAEIGVRMALGATAADISRMVLREALVMTCGGLLLGVPVGYASKRLAASLIQDLPVKSNPAIASGAAAMVAIALLAAYLPARRAARVDPVEALRYE